MSGGKFGNDKFDCTPDFKNADAGEPDCSELLAVRTDEAELLPCPFCGCEADVEEYDDKFDDCSVRIECKSDDCPGAHTWQDDYETAVKLWNARAS